MVGSEVGVGYVLLCVHTQQMVFEIGRASSGLICWSQEGLLQSRAKAAGQGEY